MGKAENTEIQSRRQELEQRADRLVATLNAQGPTKAQLAELRELIKDVPSLVGVYGDLSRNLQGRIIRHIAPQPGLHIMMEARAKELAEELGLDTASPLERLLIEQVVIAWLRWQSVELNYQGNFEQSITLTKALYLEKRLSAAQRRYLQAIESLARVRRLLSRAPVQINIAQQQLVQNG